MELRVTFKGQVHSISLGSPQADASSDTSVSLAQLGEAVAAVTGVAYHTIKLLVPGVKGPVIPSASPSRACHVAGVHDGARVMLVASAAGEVAAVQHARELPGLAGFDHELLRAARRRRVHAGHAGGILTAPTGLAYTFGGYAAWEYPGLKPPPNEALQLLYRLARDPGVTAVMTAHGYSVGMLREMPPEGKVGISPVCVLGLNTNAGQEIQLRLRTDDLLGFRKYERIRDTLMHELAHNEFGDHDNNFKALNSQLVKECEAAVRSHASARALESSPAASGTGTYATASDYYAAKMSARVRAGGSAAASELDLVLDPQDVMAATKQKSGRTLRQLAVESPWLAVSSALQAPAGAGSSKQQHEAVPVSRVLPPQGRLVDAGMGFGLLINGAEQTHGSGHAASGSDTDSDGADIASRYEHFDPVTAQAEVAMSHLGSLQQDDAAVGMEGDAGLHDTHEQQLRASPCGIQPGTQHKRITGSRPAYTPEDASVDLSPPAASHQPDLIDQDAAVGASPEQAEQSSEVTRPGQGPIIDAAAALHTDTTAQQTSTSSTALGQGAMPCLHGSPVLARKVELGPCPFPPAPSPPSGLPDAGMSLVDDLMQQKLVAAWEGLAASCTAMGGDVEAFSKALDTLKTLLGNIARSPNDQRFQQVRVSNPALQRRLGTGPALTGAVCVLQAAGFTQQQPQQHQAYGSMPPAHGAVGEVVLQWTRKDVGLLWAVMSVLQAAEERLSL